MPKLGKNHNSLFHSPLENYKLNIVQIHLLLFNFLKMESNNTNLSSSDFFAQYYVCKSHSYCCKWYAYLFLLLDVFLCLNITQFIHFITDGFGGWIQFLAITDIVAMNILAQLLMSIYTFLLHIYLGDGWFIWFANVQL